MLITFIVVSNIFVRKLSRRGQFSFFYYPLSSCTGGNKLNSEIVVYNILEMSTYNCIVFYSDKHIFSCEIFWRLNLKNLCKYLLAYLQGTSPVLSLQLKYLSGQSHTTTLFLSIHFSLFSTV